MRHIQHVSQKQTGSVNKAMDPAGEVFLQIWFTVFSSILLGAFGLKG